MGDALASPVPDVAADITPIASLNATLAEVARRLRAHHGENLVGLYVQGSFAVGDFDEATSDADLIVALDRDVPQARASPLRALHAELHRDLPRPWGLRLELSYAPLAVLRRWSSTPRDPSGEPRDDAWRDPATAAPPRVYPLWYLDHGSDQLVRSEHDNTRVVRWVLRNRGLTVLGPPVAGLVDEVTADDLREEGREVMALVAREWATPARLDAAWLPAFFVTLHARLLHADATGVVASKRAATEWARGHLDPRWRPTIRAAHDAWVGDRTRLMGPADPATVADAIAFMRYARDLATAPAAG